MNHKDYFKLQIEIKENYYQKLNMLFRIIFVDMLNIINHLFNKIYEYEYIYIIMCSYNQLANKNYFQILSFNLKINNMLIIYIIMKVCFLLLYYEIIYLKEKKNAIVKYLTPFHEVLAQFYK